MPARAWSATLGSVRACLCRQMSQAERLVLASALPGLAGQPQRPEALLVIVERLLRGLVLAHRLFGIGAALGVAGLALFGGEDFGRTDFIFFCHDQPTHEALKGSVPGSIGGTRSVSCPVWV